MDSEFTGSISGRITLDETAGERLVAALTEQLDRVEQWMARAGALARPLPLGDNPVGTALSEKFSRRADGGAGSFVAALEAYRTVLERSRDAARRSMLLYRDVEAQHADGIARIAG